MSRLLWADRLKGCLIILVVLGHAIQHAFGPSCEDNHLWNIIYSFHMPAFMAVSGYLVYRPQAKRVNLSRRFLQLMVPFLAWSLIMFFLNPPYQARELASYILKPDTSFWFLWVLFWIAVLFWVGDWLAERLRATGASGQRPDAGPKSGHRPGLDPPILPARHLPEPYRPDGRHCGDAFRHGAVDVDASNLKAEAARICQQERYGADKAQAIVRRRPRTRPAAPEGGTRT